MDLWLGLDLGRDEVGDAAWLSIYSEPQLCLNTVSADQRGLGSPVSRGQRPATLNSRKSQGDLALGA